MQDNLRALVDPDLRPARVAIVDRGRQLLLTRDGPVWATTAGRVFEDGPPPVVGDWVAYRTEAGSLQVTAVLPRRSVLERKAVGKSSRAQTIAANLDRVFVVTAVGADFSPRRLERYLTLVWDGGAAPVIVVTKTDLEHDEDGVQAALDEVSMGVPVAFVSSLAEDGLAALDEHLVPGETVALVGSSGVGKSTIINRLLGEQRQTTHAVRDGDDKGRHTTTRRELVVLPSGALLIDTPGMRELGLSADPSAVDDVFADVQQLAEGCRFTDCGHAEEPGCAVQAALEDGTLSAKRWQSYVKLSKEAAYEARRADAGAQYDTKRRWKEIHMQMRARKKVDPKLREH